ncbi:MAG: hypothetical protein WCK36_02500, partial [Candidatus Firestonebacteria bacterium]
MLKIYSCPFSPVKGKTPSEEVLNRLKAEQPGKSVLYISPSGRKAEEVKSSFAGGQKNWAFYSLDRFVNKVLEGKNTGRYADDKLKLILITEILSSEEKYASLFNSSPGTVNVLVELLTDLKNYGYGEDIPELKKKLETLLDTFDRVAERAVFAAEILGKYQQTMKALGFTDDVDRLALAGKLLRKNKTGYELLVLDGFFDITARQKEFFTALINSSPETVLLYYQEEGLEETAEIKSDFPELAEISGKTAVVKIESGKKLRNLAAQNIVKALSMEAEVSGIARRIVQLKKNKSEYRNIIVTFPSMFGYLPYVERIFPKYKIPFSTSVDRPFLSLPQIVPVTLLLKCVLEGLPRRTLVDLLSSPGLKVFKQISREIVSPVSRKAGITGGLLQWQELGDRLKNEAPDYYEEHAENIKTLEEDLKKVFLSLRVLEKDMNLPEFTGGLRKALQILKYSLPEKDISKSFYELLGSMEKLLTVFKGKKNTPGENARLFLNILSRAHYQEEKREPEAVRVLGVLDTRGLYCEHLFFGGLSDGEFPLKPKQEMIIPDKTRKELGLVHFLRRIELQRLHFYRLLQAPAVEIYLSYPVQKDDKLVIASNFLPEAGKGSGEAVDTAAVTTEELQLEAGRKAGTSGAFFTTSEFKDKKAAAK